MPRRPGFVLEETRRRSPLSLFHDCLMLRAEDFGRLDLHPLYLHLGPDAESRYGAYMALVAADVGREPLAFAGRYFAGSRRSLGSMAKKFGLAGPGARDEREEHGVWVFSLRPRHGGPSEAD